MKNKTTLYHFIVDQSGSMAGLEEQTIAGFNAQLKTIQDLKMELPDQSFLCSLTFFNGIVQDRILFQEVSALQPLSRDNYFPSSNTALLDAIGKSIYSIKHKYADELVEDKISIVLVIITDGHENASRLYTYHDIAHMIKELDETGKWTFSFLGADFDAIHTSHMLNIRKENVINFSKSSYSGMMEDVSLSIRSYAEEKTKGNLKRDIFDIFSNKDKTKK
ncbi:MAG: hypothetical protein K9I37_05205 [Crocinitomicaceae bacterium]|jgi:hypothetical protein|nr:hypothetical protein [Crocinitomicaceae bacterium]